MWCDNKTGPFIASISFLPIKIFVMTLPQIKLGGCEYGKEEKEGYIGPNARDEASHRCLSKCQIENKNNNKDCNPFKFPLFQ